MEPLTVVVVVGFVVVVVGLVVVVVGFVVVVDFVVVAFVVGLAVVVVVGAGPYREHLQNILGVVPKGHRLVDENLRPV